MIQRWYLGIGHLGFKVMRIVYLTYILLLTSLVQADTEELIYQPRILSPELKSELDLTENNWQLGLKLGQSLAENQDVSSNMGIAANYLIWDKWYAAVHLDFKKWQITPDVTESAIAWSVGAGYSVLQGAAYITEGLTLPWQMYAELNVGEQVLDQVSSNIASGAIGWQLSDDNNYAALEWRYFQMNDNRLKQLDSDKGYECSITFGKYF
jgi:hypothetical protein